MLKKLTSKGDWETSENTVTTKGGVFVGYAKKEEDAKMFVAGAKLYEWIQQRFSNDSNILKEVEAIFKSV